VPQPLAGAELEPHIVGMGVISMTRPAAALAAGLLCLILTAAASVAGEGEERRVFVTPHQERPLVHEHPGRHYLAPAPLSTSRTAEPFIKPDYYEAPPPATQKYRGEQTGTGGAAGPAGSSPLGAGSGSGRGILRPIN
jgi:hypothetical protein